MSDNNITITEEMTTPTPEDDPKIDEARLISDYLKKTSRKSAVESLLCNIETIHQGIREVWPTGIDALDKKLDGGFHPKQLVFIGAISSLGKTSLALQIADNVARSGRDVLIFSLEMDSDELLAKSISRETYRLTEGDDYRSRFCLTTRDILSGNVGTIGSKKRDLFDEALAETRKHDDHMFYYIGENDIDIDSLRAMVELHRKARNQSPLVILDYLQILRPSQEALSRRLEKRLLTDDDVTKLRVLARDLNLPVVAISAFNRESYLQTVSTSSFKESSGIEYSSDVLLGMQYTNTDYKKHWYKTEKMKKASLVYESKQDHENRVRDLFDRMDRASIRPLELKILKNRNGRKGSVFFDFIAKYNYFEETGTDEHKPRAYFDIIGKEKDDIEISDSDNTCEELEEIEEILGEV